MKVREQQKIARRVERHAPLDLDIFRARGDVSSGPELVSSGIELHGRKLKPGDTTRALAQRRS